MKNKRCWWITTILCMVVLSFPAWAQQAQVTKEECVAQVAKAVDRIKRDNFEAVAPEIKPGGPFTWKSDGYVFCMDATEGVMLAHPYLPQQMMNRPLMGWRDSNGKAFIREMVELADKDGKGWVSYMTKIRGSDEVRLKETYIEKVPGENIIVGAGYFPQEK